MPASFTTPATWEIREPRHTDNGDSPSLVRDANQVGCWIFAQAPGESDADALARCSQNLAVGASNATLDRQYPENTGIFPAPDYVRAREDELLVTRLPSTAEVYGCAFVRCTDGQLGVGADDRAFIMGSYGNTLNQGWALYWNSPTNLRLLTYEDDDTLRTADFTYGVASAGVFRLVDFSISATEMKLWDVTDGGAAVVTALPTGHGIGAQTVSLLGRVTTGTDFTASITKDLAIARLYDAVLNDVERAIVHAQMRDYIVNSTALVEGS